MRRDFTKNRVKSPKFSGGNPADARRETHHQRFPHRYAPKELTWAQCHKTLLFPLGAGFASALGGLGQLFSRSNCFATVLKTCSKNDQFTLQLQPVTLCSDPVRRSSRAVRSMRLHSLLIVLTVARTTAYDYGEDITLCWAKHANQSTSEREDCRGADVLWGASGASDSSALEKKLLSSVAYQVAYRAVVPQQRTGHQPALSIPHGNIHSCLRKVGFCTPFVKSTKELSTHSPALTGEFELGAADGVFRSTLTSEVQLEEGDHRVGRTYLPPTAPHSCTVIAQVRTR